MHGSQAVDVGARERGSSPDYQVLTPERVSLRYDIAGIGSRSAAAMVDVALQMGALLVLLFGLIGISAAIGIAGNPLGRLVAPGASAVWGAVILAVVLLGMFLILWGYYLIFEIVWNGQTPGKRLMGIRVIRENGYPIRAGDAVIRNLIRIVDGPPFAVVVGLFVMLLNERAKRLGDFAAGTVVVREGSRRQLASLANMGLEAERPGETVALSAEDASLVRDFLVRRHRLQPDARADLAERLAGSLARRYGLTTQAAAQTPESFLERLVGSGTGSLT